MLYETKSELLKSVSRRSRKGCETLVDTVTDNNSSEELLTALGNVALDEKSGA